MIQLTPWLFLAPSMLITGTDDWHVFLSLVFRF